MTILRTNAGINKEEGTGRIDAQIGFADALREIFLTALARYLPFRAWIRQETLYNPGSVTFDLRQCGQLPPHSPAQLSEESISC